ncbi:methylenetetrahydrofolate reductase [Lipingzhangella sp. LS1_29]|uniref:Methylenetetrahydrofolate reductase n=1 Tax=Lipingzhangella rawalii TaxID=2055835 RepID=A0ABU2H2S1_9ACTN|nr:methylenetetrahydrofolate reductase [Lipingzhangella rawalii]MDS1269598.1 methylenetetrahydrofolate reductase [Lipingzhangella rawalii]
MSQLAELLRSGHRPVVTAELPVIDGGGMATVRSQVAHFAPYVDGINATDNTAAHAHASNVAVAIAIRQLGVEPILQVVCRDKNRLALQADIMGAAMHDVTTVCCLTGDDVTAGDEPESRRVFDLDAPQLVRTAAGMAAGQYMSGRVIDPAPDLFIGAVENPAVPPFEQRVRRAQTKAAAGARFLQLQICYHPERLEAFTQLAQRVGLTRKTALLQSVCLTRGARGLRFMNREVPGIHIPEETLEWVDNAADPAEAAYQVTLGQARHALSLPGISGLHIADFRMDDSLGRLFTDLGLGGQEMQDVEELPANPMSSPTAGS